MGSAASKWELPTDEKLLLSVDEVREIVGEKHFDLEKFNLLTDGEDKITVWQLKAALYEFAKDYAEQHGDEESIESIPPPDRISPETADDASALTHESNVDEEKPDDASALSQDPSTVKDTVIGGDMQSIVDEHLSDSDDEKEPGITLTAEEFDELIIKINADIDTLQASCVCGVHPPTSHSIKSNLQQSLLTYYQFTKTPFPIVRDAGHFGAYFVADYYHFIDTLQRDKSVASKYYTEKSTLKCPETAEVVGESNVIPAIQEIYSSLCVRHEVVALEATEGDAVGMIFVIVVKSQLKVENDKPRNVLEVFYINKREVPTKSGDEYYIHRQVLCGQDARPLYLFADSAIPAGNRDNWDYTLGPKPRPPTPPPVVEAEKPKKKKTADVEDEDEDSDEERSILSRSETLKSYLSHSSSQLTKSISRKHSVSTVSFTRAHSQSMLSKNS